MSVVWHFPGVLSWACSSGHQQQDSVKFEQRHRRTTFIIGHSRCASAITAIKFCLRRQTDPVTILPGAGAPGIEANDAGNMLVYNDGAILRQFIYMVNVSVLILTVFSWISGGIPTRAGLSYGEILVGAIKKSKKKRPKGAQGLEHQKKLTSARFLRSAGANSTLPQAGVECACRDQSAAHARNSRSVQDGSPDERSY